MKTSTKLLIAGAILLLIPIRFWTCKLIGLICIIIALAQIFKRFLFELIDHIKGTDTSTEKNAYAAEARRACERVTPKKDKYETPPWEE